MEAIGNIFWWLNNGIQTFPGRFWRGLKEAWNYSPLVTAWRELPKEPSLGSLLDAEIEKNYWEEEEGEKESGRDIKRRLTFSDDYFDVFSNDTKQLWEVSLRGSKDVIEIPYEEACSKAQALRLARKR